MHAHINIAYTRENGESIESLCGFDPRTQEGRELAHAFLDEYMDQLERGLWAAERAGKKQGRIDSVPLDKIDPDNRKDWPEMTEAMGGLFVSPYFHN